MARNVVRGGNVETIHERLRHARAQTGQTAAEVAAECDVSRQAIAAYESESIGVVPGGLAIMELCYAYGITADWLLGIPPVRQR
jgi:transcriptional regulator with XRE-family HTH domain